MQAHVHPPFLYTAATTLMMITELTHAENITVASSLSLDAKELEVFSHIQSSWKSPCL
jgi:hypothetical protein